MVVVSPESTTPAPSTTPAVTPPPRTAATIGLASSFLIAAMRVAGPSERSLKLQSAGRHGPAPGATDAGACLPVHGARCRTGGPAAGAGCRQTRSGAVEWRRTGDRWT